MDRDTPEETENDAEGVRLVGRDEADAALRSGKAVGRHSPQVPAGEGPTRSAPHTQGVIRFPREVDLDATSEHRPTLMTKREELESMPTTGERIIDIRDAVDDNADKEAEKVAANGFPSVDMPHWTERPAGSTSEGVGNNFGAGDRPDRNLFSWSTLGDGENDEVDAATGETTKATSPFDEADEDAADDAPVEDEPKAEKSADDGEPPKPTGGSHRQGNGLNRASLTTRVITGVAAAALACVAFAAGPAATLALALVVVLAAAIELFDALRKSGYRPATLLGLLGVTGMVLGAYARGSEALPLVLTLTIVFSFLWFLTGVSKAKPTANIAITVMAVVWVGVLGAYAALLLRLPNNEGLAFLIGAVAVTIAYDTGAYVGGSMFGRRPLVPSVSPNKTWEGLAAGTVAAVLVGGLLVSIISPWGVLSGILLGVVVAVVAPLGDLAESMIKRDLGLKDMGNLLPGHGGVLDRFDALLFVLPATYYLVLLLGLA